MPEKTESCAKMISAMTDLFRDRIRALEALKNKIVAIFRGTAHLDPATIDMWCGDAGEMYYQMVAAGDLLSGNEEAASARLEAAVLRYGQVQSEVRALGDSQEALGRGLDQIFGACLYELRARPPR